MRQTALAYPWVTPDEATLKWLLLAFDRVKTIVPVGNFAPGERLEWLRANDLWSPTYAHDLGDEVYLEEVTAALDRFASDPQLSFAGGYPPVSQLMRLFLGKLQPGVEAALLERGLAKLANRRSYIAVHQQVGRVLLAVSARHLARASVDLDEEVIPCTDTPDDLSFAFDPLGGRLRAHDCVRLLLPGLFPMPAPEVPLHEVVEFRLRHDRELRAWRQAMRDLCRAIAGASDPETQLRAARAEIEDAVASLASRVRARRWRITAASLVVLAGSGVLALAPETAPIALSGIAGTVGISLVPWTSRHQPAHVEPFAYLYDAQHALSRTRR